MKAVIYLDVPEWQIGQEVKVYFPDSMVKTGKCEKAKIVQKPERLLPCKCGCKRRSHWTVAGRGISEKYKLMCLKCGFEVYGSSEIDLHKKWNEAINNLQKKYTEKRSDRIMKCEECRFRDLCKEMEYPLDCEDLNKCEHYDAFLEGLEEYN